MRQASTSQSPADDGCILPEASNLQALGPGGQMPLKMIRLCRPAGHWPGTAAALHRNRRCRGMAGLGASLRLSPRLKLPRVARSFFSDDRHDHRRDPASASGESNFEPSPAAASPGAGGLPPASCPGAAFGVSVLRSPRLPGAGRAARPATRLALGRSVQL